MTEFTDQVAVITGSTSGIGRAIAVRLASRGATICLLGRRQEVLQEVAEVVKTYSPNSKEYSIDLTLDEDIHQLSKRIRQDLGKVNILVHSAGAFSMGSMESAPIDHLDWLYRINVRAPYLLTQLLLPDLIAQQGQIVFINSAVGLTARADISQYAATKFALKAIADSLREEVNAAGVRVLSVYPGRTNSPMQMKIHEIEGKPYQPESLMQPQDVASVIATALNLPRTTEITEINMRPLIKP